MSDLVIVSTTENNLIKIVWYPTTPGVKSGRLRSLFHLVCSVPDSLEFVRNDGSLKFTPVHIADIGWYAEVGKILEQNFQTELQELIPQTEKQFNLHWYPEFWAKELQ